MRTATNFRTLFLFISLNIALTYQQAHAHFAVSRTSVMHAIEDPALFAEKWDELPQVAFWHKVITLSPDSAVINDRSDRKMLKTIKRWDWIKMSKTQRAKMYRDLRAANSLKTDAPLYFSEGRNDFYTVDKVLPQLGTAISVFEKEQVNPWYAQSILLIESPASGQQASNVGAYGAFQLMPDVARHYGLTVNAELDERGNFSRSATAAARLIRKSCIPQTERMLASLNIGFDSDDLWFRLIVLHVYHAGARNVKAALTQTGMTQGGQALIQKLWKTQSRGFKNASQNYSQVALAAQLELSYKVNRKHKVLCDEITESRYGSLSIVAYTKK